MLPPTRRRHCSPSSSGVCVQQIRVLLASPPGMLRDIVESAVTAESDMRLVGDFGGREESSLGIASLIAEAVEAQAPDVVIVDRVDGRSMRLLDGLLYDHPRLAV